MAREDSGADLILTDISQVHSSGSSVINSSASSIDGGSRHRDITLDIYISRSHQVCLPLLGFDFFCQQNPMFHSPRFLPVSTLLSAMLADPEIVPEMMLVYAFMSAFAINSFSRPLQVRKLLGLHRYQGTLPACCC